MSVDGWTLAIQFLNVAILVWLLAHFFWRPVAGMIEERRHAVDETLQKAANARTEIDQARADIARTRSGFDAEREQIVAAAREAARAQAEEIVSAARKEAAGMRDAATAAVARDRAEAEEAWRGRASQLAVDIAGRLLASLDPGTTLAAFLDGVENELRQLPDRVRTPDPTGGDGLRIATATALDADARDECRRRLQAALGHDWPVDFEVDAAVLGGIEVEGPAFRVRNSWRAALERVAGELGHDSDA